MKILVACEESQAVTKELRAKGHEAFSCDILPCSGGHPEWHLQQDVTELLKQKWDMIIAFPPCTYLTNAGMCNLTRKGATDEYRANRLKLRDEARDFVLKIYNSNCEKIAIENPVGFLNSNWRKPDQIIKPYEYGHSVNKKTCLWLKGLPKLTPTNIVEKGEVTIWEGTGKSISVWYKQTLKDAKGDLKLLSKIRSKTFKGIAEAMAEQWT
jgi:site-specific DNA-cytosine methylase